MRRTVSILLIALMPAVGAAQKEAPPSGGVKKGDVISVRGCLTGSALEATDIGTKDALDALASGTTFRLTGDKNLLKQMRDKHNHRVVDVEGVLKSDLGNDGVASRKVGKMRITIGAPNAHPGTPETDSRRSLPVLQVKSFEGSTTSCER